MDLRGIPAIDGHAHPFPPESLQLSEGVLRNAVSVSLRGKTSTINETMLLSRFLIRQLSELLACEANWPAVIAVRNQRASRDYRAYVAQLFDDAGIDRILVDHGYPTNPEIPFDTFAGLLPKPPIQGYRVERFFSATGSFHEQGRFRSFRDMVDAFEARLDEAVATEGHRFYKSIMAYRTGLAIQLVDDVSAEVAWKAHERYGDQAEKLICDYLFVFTARKARQYNVPFQLHTGHTSHVNVWPNTNPILLTPILNSGVLDGTTLVLVHGGYPYCTEAGYLTSVFPDVFLDLSLMIPWASAGVSRRIWQTLESAPIAKVMYGSDGIMCPEMHWISAHLGRLGLSNVLDELVKDHFLTGAQAEDAARDILYRTAHRVYDIGKVN